MRIHITNGDSAGAVIQRVVGDEPVLPWRDVLHEGPVPGGLSLPALSAVRATFIIERGWGRAPEVFENFAKRDALIGRLQAADDVTLWFEHDLFDQLQLAQLLDLLGGGEGLPGRLCIVQADRYLGAMTTGEVAALRSAERPVEEAQLALGREAWAAFRAATPEPLAALLARMPTALPFLAPAIARLLAELPQPRSGLARTEQLILEVLAHEPVTLAKLYSAVQAREPAIFMGDMPFYGWLERLGTAADPLVAGLPLAGLPMPLASEAREIELGLTATGREVLVGAADWLMLHPVNRWLGGTHLRRGQIWRFEPRSAHLTRDPAAPDRLASTRSGERGRAALGSPA